MIELALLEDLDGVGDVTSSAVFSDETDEFYLISKSEGVLCGRRLFEKVMAKVDPSVSVKFHFSDGDALKKGDCVADVSREGSFDSSRRTHRNQFFKSSFRRCNKDGSAGEGCRRKSADS